MDLEITLYSVPEKVPVTKPSLLDERVFIFTLNEPLVIFVYRLVVEVSNCDIAKRSLV